MAKKKKKATRCTRKTKAGTRCKAKAPVGRKTCVAHGGPTKKKAKRKNAKKKARKKTRRKAKKVRRSMSGRKSNAKCRKIIASGTRCKCYCEPGGIYCVSHRKKDKKATKAKIRKNPNPSSINLPW